MRSPRRSRSRALPALASARALWAGPGAVRALAGARCGSVEIALWPGGYVRLDGGEQEWLLVAVARAPRGPLTLLAGGLEHAPLAPGAPVRVVRGALDAAAAAAGQGVALDAAAPAAGQGVALDAGAPAAGQGGVLEIGALRVGLDGLGAPPAAAPPPTLRAGWPGALAAALAQVPAPPAELVPGIEALGRGALDEAVDRLAGLGDGLTPAGDDVLAGFAAWRHAGGDRPALAARAAGWSSPIGLAYLRCAERGELPDAAARALRAIRAGDARLAGLRARTLSRWGASSGAAILWGIAAGGAGARA